MVMGHHLGLIRCWKQIVSNFNNCFLDQQKGEKMILNHWGSNTKATKKAMSSISSSTQRAQIQVLFLAKAKSHICVSGVLVDQHTHLEEVFIFFDTATYDQIDRDVKVNKIPWLKLLRRLIILSHNDNMHRGHKITALVSLETNPALKTISPR